MNDISLNAANAQQRFKEKAVLSKVVVSNFISLTCKLVVY